MRAGITPALAQVVRGSTPGVGWMGAGVDGRVTEGSYLGSGLTGAGLSSIDGQRTEGNEALEEPEDAHALRNAPTPPNAATRTAARTIASRRESGGTGLSFSRV
jgi:hypothetical protein